MSYYEPCEDHPEAAHYLTREFRAETLHRIRRFDDDVLEVEVSPEEEEELEEIFVTVRCGECDDEQILDNTNGVTWV